MSIYYPNYFFLFLLLFSFACQQKEINTESAFYYWKSVVNLTDFEIQYLMELDIKKVYVKFFDVDWDFEKTAPFPTVTILHLNSFPTNLELIPTVFITNRTLSKLPEDQIEKLAENIFQKIKLLAKDIQFKELQWDCDWTKSTQSKYFQLLDLLKQKFDGSVVHSATIRLHQIKYPEQTGVPPVDKGMLMFYNMDKVAATDTKNSILDIEVAKKYIDRLKDYKLDLDVGLPVFQWAVLFRDGQMIRLINQIDFSEFDDHDRFVKVDDQHYEVKKSTYLNGVYLYELDKIRLESVNLEVLKASANLLKLHLKPASRCISFYHLDSLNLSAFHYEQLQEVYHLLD